MSFEVSGKEVTDVWIDDVDAAARYLIKKSCTAGESVHGRFNEIPISASPSDTPDGVVRRWREVLVAQVDQRKRERAAQEFKKEADRRQALLNVLMFHIPDRVEELMLWLCEVAKLADHAGTSIDSDRLKQHLISLGYDIQDAEIPGSYEFYSSVMLERHLAAQVIGGSDKPHGRMVPRLVDIWQKKKAAGE